MVAPSRFLPVFVLVCLMTFSYKQYEQAAPPGSVAPGASDKLLFEETFEGANPFSTAHNLETGDWQYALQYVNSPVYRGRKAVRFEIREDQPLVKNGKRSEVTIVDAVPDKNRWYSFAVYFPSDGFATDSEQEIISQWRQRPDYHLGEDGGSPATALRVKRDKFILDVGYNAKQVSDGVAPGGRKKIELGAVTKNTWHEFVFHFVHSYGEDGLVEVWHNGEKILTHKGGNMYNNVMLPKWKIGLYKASFKHGTSEVSKRIAYFDDIRVGSEKAAFADMTSGAQTARKE